MAINLSVIPYQLTYDGKTYFVYNREVVGVYTYAGYKTKNGEVLIVRSKTDESEIRYHVSVDYDADWTNKGTIEYAAI